MPESKLAQIYYAFVPEVEDLIGKQSRKEDAYEAMCKISNGIRELHELTAYWQLDDDTLCKLINIAADIAYE